MNKVIHGLIVGGILALSPIYASAETQVPAEKAWTVELNTHPLETTENFKKIFVTSANGEKIKVNVRVNQKDKTKLEILPDELLKAGVYTVTIDKGFLSKKNLATQNLYSEQFIATSPLTTTDLKGTWTTQYTHEGKKYEITSSYLNGIANLIVTTENISLNGPEAYSLVNGQMEMNISDFNVQLNGKLNIFNDKTFLITSPSGKEAIFNKK